MGKTWKNRDGHRKGVGNRRGKGEEYGHNWRHTETDDDIRPDNSRYNHRSMRKAKEQRRNFEDNFPDINIEF